MNNNKYYNVKHNKLQARRTNIQACSTMSYDYNLTCHNIADPSSVGANNTPLNSFLVLLRCLTTNTQMNLVISLFRNGR